MLKAVSFPLILARELFVPPSIVTWTVLTFVFYYLASLITWLLVHGFKDVAVGNEVCYSVGPVVSLVGHFGGHVAGLLVWLFFIFQERISVDNRLLRHALACVTQTRARAFGKLHDILWELKKYHDSKSRHDPLAAVHHIHALVALNRAFLEIYSDFVNALVAPKFGRGFVLFHWSHLKARVMSCCSRTKLFPNILAWEQRFDEFGEAGRLLVEMVHGQLVLHCVVIIHFNSILSEPRGKIPDLRSARKMDLPLQGIEARIFIFELVMFSHFLQVSSALLTIMEKLRDEQLDFYRRHSGFVRERSNQLIERIVSLTDGIHHLLTLAYRV